MNIKNITRYVFFSVLTLSQIFFAAKAATIFVTSSLDDDGNGCTLREAIVGVNSPTSQAVQNSGCILGDGNNDTINFLLAPGSVISLQDSHITIARSLTINGLGADLLTIDGANSVSGFFAISADDVILQGLTLQNASVDGFAINVQGVQGVDNFQLLDCRVIGNTTRAGPLRVALSSNAKISDCEFSDNVTAAGPGAIVMSRSSGEIQNSTFIDNSSGQNGGAVLLSDSPGFVVTHSLFARNQAARGGAIAVLDSSISVLDHTEISNSTFTGNFITVDGPFTRNGNVFILTIENSGVELINNTIVNNGDPDTAASSIFVTSADNSTSSLAIYNNIITGNMAVSDVPSAFLFRDPDLSSIQSGGNIIGDASRLSAQEVSGAIPGSNFFAGADQLNLTISQIVGSLSNNGGPTLTFSLAQSSIAIDGAIADVCPELDQRGFIRATADTLCDVGAFEDGALEFAEEDSFFVVPLRSGGRSSTVIFNL